MGKKVIVSIIIILLNLVFSYMSLASLPVKVMVNNQEIAFDVPPVIENARTLVPLRAIFEALGAEISWEPYSKTVTAVKGDVTVRLVVGSTVAFKNQEEIILDVPAKIIRNRTMVPLRFVSEALGAKVKWNAACRLITITTDTGEEVVVTGSVVNIRSGPGTDHEVLTQVSCGTRLPVVDRQAQWYKVELPGGKVGWIIAWYVAKEERQDKSGPDNNDETKEDESGRKSDEEKPDEKEPGEVTQNEKELDGDLNDPVQEEEKEGEEGEDEVGDKDLNGSAPEDGEDEEENVLNVSVYVEGDVTKARVSVSQELIYNIFRLFNPDRLVVDIEGVRPGDIPYRISVNSDAVSSLRVGLFSRDPDITRLVFDLNRQVIYKVTACNQKSIELGIYAPDIKDVLKGKLIVLDPGHGGSDPGAIGPAGLKEKDVNLDVARRAARLLDSYGARVILTRNSDTYVGLYERVGIANSLGADLFISIHMNANTNSLIKGTSTFYARSVTNGAYCQEKNRLFAECIQGQLLSFLGTEDRGIMQANFVVIRETIMPAVLVEAAFISNPEEEELMSTKQFRENIAQAIVQGIGDYFIRLQVNLF